MVGSNRIVKGVKIVNPLGDPDLAPEEEKVLRRRILEKALQALGEDIADQKMFE